MGPNAAEATPPEPNTSDDYIVSKIIYDSSTSETGPIIRTVDNAGTITETQYDLLGREIRTIQNYDDGTVLETELDQDVMTEYQYDANGRLAALIAYNAKGSGNGVEEQKTVYLYESDYNASWQTAVVYPDSTDTISQDGDGVWSITSGDDHTETTYDRMARTVTVTDQRGVTHEDVYDNAGRLASDTITSLGTSGDVDDSVLRVSATYDDMGRVQTFTSYSDTAGMMIVNQIVYEYDGWGNLYREYQEHDGAVDANTLYIQYDYDDGDATGTGAAKYVRIDTVTYPSNADPTDGREIHYDYGTTGAIDDIMSRIAAIKDDDDTTVLASYKYLGASTIVTEDYESAQVKLDYNADGNLGSFDRFGRIVDQIWTDYSTTPETVLDEYTYEYDRAGNRTSKDNELNATLDEDYIYDDLGRLIEWKVNDVSQQTWTLDSLGNDLSSGTYNEANEMTPTVGSSGYDAAGNMTTLQSGDTAVYDAWNRLVEVKNGEDIIQQNEYDGTNRRIQIFSDFTGSTPATIQDDYHRDQQVIETRENSAIKYQNIWSPRYIDALILRDTYSSGSIVTAERIFYLSDANCNVTALVKYDSGQWQVVERYTYTPYGVATFRNASWTDVGSSANNNTTLYTGRTLDLLTDLYYYRARYYDANLERFISRDPIGYDGSPWNLYEYVKSTPIDLVDPMGHKHKPIVNIYISNDKCTDLDIKFDRLAIMKSLQRVLDRSGVNLNVLLFDGIKKEVNLGFEYGTTYFTGSSWQGFVFGCLCSGFASDAAAWLTSDPVAYHHNVTFVKNTRAGAQLVLAITPKYETVINANNINAQLNTPDPKTGKSTNFTKMSKEEATLLWTNFLAHEVLYLGMLGKKDTGSVLSFSSKTTPLSSGTCSTTKAVTINQEEVEAMNGKFD